MAFVSRALPREWSLSSLARAIDVVPPNSTRKAKITVLWANLLPARGILMGKTLVLPISFMLEAAAR